MPDRESEYDPVAELAEDFLARYRRGERPSASDYAVRYPELAAVLGDLLVTLEMMEAAAEQQFCSDSSPEAQTTEPALRPQRIGEYRIVGELGRGGMGVVYHALQESLDRPVALKVLPFQALCDAVRRERFRREAHIAARLHHSNIVPVFGTGEWSGLHYLAMQYIEGQSLDRVLHALRRKRLDSRPSPQPAVPGEHARVDDASQAIAARLLAGQLRGAAPKARTDESARAQSTSGYAPPNKQGAAYYHRAVARIGIQVAGALAYAHGQGVLHRDIKPSNLILDEQGTVWVLDFGLAKHDADEQLTCSGDVVGTLRYLAPERLRGQIDRRGDIYSLGMTLYELLALRPAFPQLEWGELIGQMTSGAPTGLRKLDPDIPRDLETIVAKATAREPERRYPTTEALADDLSCFLAGRAIGARRAWPHEHLRLWCRRNPSNAALVGLVTLLLVASSLGASVAALLLRTQRDVAVANLSRAVRAEGDLAVKLYESYLNQAQGQRASGIMGQRYESLASVLAARRLLGEPTEPQRLELRNQAIAALALADLRVDCQWPETAVACPHVRVGFDIDVQRAATVLPDGTVVIYSLADGRELLRMVGLGPVTDDTSRPLLRFSPNGKLLAVKGRSTEGLALAVFDLQQREEKFRCAVGGVWHDAGLAFDDSSRTVAAVAPDGTVALYAAETGELRGRCETGAAPYCLQFAPGGRRLAATTGPHLQVFDVSSARIELDIDAGHILAALAWDADGRRLIGGGEARDVSIWDAETGQLQRTLNGHQAQIRHVSFNRAGDRIASTSWDDTTRLWDAATGECLVVGPRFATRFSRDDRYLAQTITGASFGRLEVAAGRELRTFVGPAENGEYNSLDFSPDGRWLAASCDSGFRLWDASTCEVVANLPAFKPSNVWFHPDGSRLISCGRFGATVRRLESRLENGVLRLQIGPAEDLGIGRVKYRRSAVMSADGSRLLLEAGIRRVALWDLNRRETITEFVGQPNARSVALSACQKWAALSSSTGSDRAVWIWDARRGERLAQLDAQHGAHVAFSPCGDWLAIGDDDRVSLLAAGTWQEMHRFPRADIASVAPALAFSPDGTIFAREAAHGIVKLVDLTSGAEIATLSAPVAVPIRSLRFSPDGAQLGVGLNNSTLQVWDLRLLRNQLAELDFDWGLPPYAPAPAPAKGRVEVELVDATAPPR